MKKQQHGKELRVRDFLYLDVERTKSIFAQLEEGLVTGRERIKGTGKEVSGSGGGGIPSLLNLAAEGKFIWENEERETKTLHDYLYHHVETMMLKKKMITVVDTSSFPIDDIKKGKLHSSLVETSFVLIQGKVKLDDYDYMKGILEQFNELSKFIAQCAMEQPPSQLTKSQMKQWERDKLSRHELPEWQLKGLKRFFDIFYRGRCMITIYPDIDTPNIYFTGHIKKLLLRDGLESVIFRYGTSPEILWNVFAQIAYIPSKDSSMPITVSEPQEVKSFDESLRGVFESLRGIERLATAIVYPAISIIPIAIYR